MKSKKEKIYILPEGFVTLKGYESTYAINREGIIINTKRSNKPVSWYWDHQYFAISLYKDGKKKKGYVHILKATHFIANPKKYKYVNHKNGRKWDNELLNLEWCSQSQNIKHAWDTGLYPAHRYVKKKVTKKYIKTMNLKVRD